MRSKFYLTACLALAGSLLLVSACASSAPPEQIYPPAVDLAVEAKPRLAPEAVDSEAALDAYDIALEVWGERGWATVARLCRWHAEMGMKGLSCPPPPQTPPRPG